MTTNEIQAFDQLLKNNLRTQRNMWKIVAGQADNYTTGCLLDFPYFKDHYKMIAIYLRKQKALYANPKAITQINLLEI